MHEIHAAISGQPIRKSANLSFHGLLAFLVLVYSSLRGLVILWINVPVSVVYGSSLFFLLLFSVYGYRVRSRYDDIVLSRIRSLLLINFFFGVYFILSDTLLRGDFDVSYLYVFLLPYIIFAFINVPVKLIEGAFFVISIGLALSVFDNYIHVVLQGAGREYLVEYNTRLRPDIVTLVSRTGEYSRIGGCTGSYHDSANILGMLGAYYYVKFFVCRSLKAFAMGFLVFVPMVMSHSAANIALFVLTLLLFLLYLMYSKGNVKLIFFIVLGLNAFVAFFAEFPQLLSFLVRLGPEGDWEGMFNSLSPKMLTSPFFWFGHGYAFNSDYVKTEVAFLKGIFEYGVFTALLLYLVLLYPLKLFIKRRRSLNLLPYLAPVIFGFLSLLHYGSLFRSTSIGLFYAMYSLFLSQYISSRHEFENERL
jgi:hypothetical protein